MVRLTRLASGASSSSGVELNSLLSGHASFGEAELPASEVAIKRKMTVWGIAILVFSCVAGGPFGIEAAVQAAGALPTVVALALAGALWGAPQALMTAELASAMPANGGPVVWARRAWGDRVAFVSSLLLVFNQVTDLCLYPTLVASYFQQLFPGVTDAWAYGIKLVALAVTVAMNVVGMEALSTSAALLTGVILAPFALLPIVAAAERRPFDWAALGPAGVAPGLSGNLTLFISTILWCMQGWSEIGCMAGEVEAAETVFPGGMLIAAVLVVVAYACPVLFGVALQPDLAAWDDGSLVTLSEAVAPWLAACVLLSAALANMSTCLTSMGAYARTLQAVVLEGMLPLPPLGRNMTRFRTPVPAIAVLAVSTAALGLLDFSTLVVVDSAYFVLANMVIQAGFLRLRYTEPDMPRPYRFPGGLRGAWAAVVTTEGLALFSLYTLVAGAPASAAVVGGTVAVLAVGGVAWGASNARARARAAAGQLAAAAGVEAGGEEGGEEGGPG
jgi:amino acid transporter